MAFYGFGEGEGGCVDVDGAGVEYLADELDVEMVCRGNFSEDVEQDFKRDVVEGPERSGHTVVSLTGSWSPHAKCQQELTLM